MRVVISFFILLIVICVEVSAQTIASVSTSTNSTICLSPNGGHRGRLIYNNSSSDLYVKFGSTASATDFSDKISAAQTLYINVGEYAGRIDCILSSGTGTAQVTEVSR